MIVKGGVCTTGYDERELRVGVCTPFKGRGEHGRGDDSCGAAQRPSERSSEEAGNMLPRRTRRSTHHRNNCGALVNVQCA